MSGAVAVNKDATEALIASYAAGDPDAWEPLFDELAPRLLGFFQRCVQDPILAEKHLQATFVELHRARSTYRPGTTGRRWLFAIATRARIEGHTCLDYPDAEASTRATPARATGENTRGHQVQQAVDGLATIERTLIHLHRFERMSFDDIAEVLGWPSAAARHHVFRAYLQLSERLWTFGDEREAP